MPAADRFGSQPSGRHILAVYVQTIRAGLFAVHPRMTDSEVTDWMPSGLLCLERYNRLGGSRQALATGETIELRLNGREALTSSEPGSRPRSKFVRRKNGRKPATTAPFDPAAFLETNAGGRVVSTHSKKDVIFSQGDDANSIFYIRKGKVKVAVVSKQGKEAVVALLGPDEFVGEGCLIGQPKRLATASAMTDCETMRVDKAEVQRVSRMSLRFRKCSSRTFWRELPGSRRTWSISSSIQRKSGWRGCCCCWPISEKKAGRSRSLRRSTRKLWPRLTAP